MLNGKADAEPRSRQGQIRSRKGQGIDTAASDRKYQAVCKSGPNERSLHIALA